MIKTDSCYIAIGERTPTNATQDQLYDVDKQFKFSLNEKPLNKLFEWIRQPSLSYDIAYIKDANSYSPFPMIMALCDSVGNIKIIADEKTLDSSCEYYRKFRNMTVPLTKEQGEYISRILYPLLYEK